MDKEESKLTDVHVTLTFDGMKYIDHNNGISEFSDVEKVIVDQSGALRCEWYSDDGGELTIKEVVCFANGMWAYYVQT